MTDKDAIDDAIFVLRGLIRECKELDPPKEAITQLESALVDIEAWKETLP